MQIANQPDWCTRLLAQVDADPTRRIREADLHQWNVDPATVRRHFLKHYGMTFQAYSRARRLTAAFQSIRNGKTTDAAAYSHGYESLSGFRAAFGQSLGCTPGSCASTDRIVLAWIDTPLGPMVAGANDEGLCLLEFTDRRMLEAQFDTIRRYFPVPILPGSHPHLDRVRNELDRYFARSLRRFTVPVVFPGTPFQRQVWEELQNIPYGETRSYQDLARSLGNPNAVRAVGRSNGFNRIGIVIPCHRVVNANGDLGGYGGGLRRKQYLLNLEQSNRKK